jgi:hypothetical protein
MNGLNFYKLQLRTPAAVSNAVNCSSHASTSTKGIPMASLRWKATLLAATIGCIGIWLTQTKGSAFALEKVEQVFNFADGLLHRGDG